ncbi:integrase core domain-containing protein [Actinomyces israelii]|uniref:integrase core domain-containing protein n=1 Tax=Actinomyces israelii TaxID=1659 RepID=UPI00338F0B95
MEGYGTRPSVGRTGVRWADAWAESFNATLKNERVHQMVRHRKKHRKKQGHPGYCLWIEPEYNQKRLHSALGHRTPGEADQEHRGTGQAS